MRRLSVCIAVAIVTFGLGIGAAYLWLSTHVQINTEVSKVPSAPHKPAGITQGRDLSVYDQGGREGCDLVLASDASRCEDSYKKARAFIWTHWQEQRRGYIIVRFASVDAVSDSHIFIEPDEGGAWHVVWRIERVLQMGHSGEVDDVPDLRSVERREARGADFQQVGTLILVFKDKDGKEIETL